MPPSPADARPARLFGPDRAEIDDLDAWHEHAPPDGAAAEAQARAWLRTGRPAMPEELAAVLLDAGLGDFDDVNARPAHPTPLGDDGDVHRHGVLACGRKGGETRFVACTLAVAGEDDLDTDPERLQRAVQATLLEAQRRGLDGAALVVHRFGTRVDDAAVRAFAEALAAAAGARLPVLTASTP
jgi:hypothetical protein